MRTATSRETCRWREATLGENTLGYEGKQILSHGADRRNKQLFIDHNWYWSSVFMTRHAVCVVFGSREVHAILHAAVGQTKKGYR